MNVIPATPSRTETLPSQPFYHADKSMDIDRIEAPVFTLTVDKGKGRQMDIDDDEPSFFAPSPTSVDYEADKVAVKIKPVAPADFDPSISACYSDDDGMPGSADSSPSSGRWKDSALDAAGGTYKEMDRLLRKFCTDHNLPFTRAFNNYLKQHSTRAPGENPWNTYTKLHAHPDHTARELDRIGYTVEQFDLLRSDEQQKVRGRCWKAFQHNFATPSEYRTALELFNKISAINEKDKGTSVAKRQKVFGALMNKLSRIVCDSSLTHSSQHTDSFFYRPRLLAPSKTSIIISFSVVAIYTQTARSWMCG